MPPAPTLWTILTWWVLPPLPVAGIAVAAGLYLRGVRIVRHRFPRHPWPVSRTVCFLTGLALVYVAVGSVLERYDVWLFSAHMIQHLFLISAAAPLLMLGAPVTLVIRSSTQKFRRGVVLPVLRSWPVAALTNPIVAWSQFALVLWGSHFSPLFDGALRSTGLHEFEHALYLASACLFWWPAFGVDPSRWKLSWPVRAVYVFMGMPQMTLLGLVLLNTDRVLYPTYLERIPPWAGSAVADQKLAAFIMWVPSEIIYVAALLYVVAKWLAAEQRKAVLIDARLDAESAAKAAAAD